MFLLLVLSVLVLETEQWGQTEQQIHNKMYDKQKNNCEDPVKV